MRSIKNVKKKPPYPLRQKIKIAYYGILDIQYWKEDKRKLPGLGWYFNPNAIISRHRMGEFENNHLGQRCFIIGNGPSLNRMDLSPLQNEITFGMNRIYLLFQVLGFQTTYYVSVNRIVIQQCAQDIKSLSIPKFISWYGRHFIVFDPSIIYI